MSLLKTFKLLNIADHDMKVYLAKLSAWAEKNIAQTQERRVETADPEISSAKTSARTATHPPSARR